MICQGQKKCTRQKASLPSAKTKALGKIHLCRVPEKNTRQRRILPCVFVCRVYFIWHSANTVFAECPIKYTRQSLRHSANRRFPVVFLKMPMRSSHLRSWLVITVFITLLEDLTFKINKSQSRLDQLDMLLQHWPMLQIDFLVTLVDIYAEHWSEGQQILLSLCGCFPVWFCCAFQHCWSWSWVLSSGWLPLFQRWEKMVCPVCPLLNCVMFTAFYLPPFLCSLITSAWTENSTIAFCYIQEPIW